MLCCKTRLNICRKGSRFFIYIMRYKISQINYYPVKSLGAVSIKEAQLDHFGIQNDRRFMLVDQNSKFITQRKYPKLSLISTKLLEDGVMLSCDGFGELFRQISLTQIGTSTIQSRAFAGMANKTLIFCLPGSTNACRTAWDEIISSQIDSRQGPCNFVPQLKNVDFAACLNRESNP